MSLGAFSSFLENLRRAFQTRESAALTDGQLLERFVRCHNDVDFAVLVERHAAMVLNVARKVLHDADDAQDVFQAAYFILAKKAKSLSGQPALAGWLYQVTFRLALKAKASKARRRIREGRAGAVMIESPDNAIDRAELSAILAEELSRMPDKYRNPLVLHYLECKSKTETARQLGCTEGTVSGRLDRARELLRRRLIRRGYTLSMAGVGTLLLGSAARGAVSAGLLTTTVQAALAFAHGLCAGVPPAAAGLASAMLRSMVLTKIKGVVSLSLVLAVLTVGAGSVALRVSAGNAVAAPGGHGALANQIDKAAAQQVSRPLPVEADQEANETREVISASGKVVNENNEPIAGATVYLREMATLREKALMQNPSYTDILAKTTTDADGRFTFKEIASESMQLSPSNIYRYPWNIVVTAKSRGLAWHVFKSRDEQDLTIIMRPEATISGQLLDEHGKPAAGVRVQINTVEEPQDLDPRKRVFQQNRLNLYFSQLPAFVVTGSDGRFVLDGLTKEHHVGLVTSDSRFARKYLSCATLSKSDIDRMNALPSVPAASKLLVDGFTARLEPSGTIRGRVTYGDTGKPAKGARVSYGVFATLTDDKGVYAFKEVASRKWHIHVRPPKDAPYFTAGEDVSLTPESLVFEQNFALNRGLLVTGEVRDLATGQTLRVPRLAIYYQKNEGDLDDATVRRNVNGTISFASSAYTEPDGSFSIVVPPGKGRIYSLESPVGRLLPDTALRNAATPIEVKPGESLSGQHLYFAVPRQVVARGKVIDTDGTPVANALFQGAFQNARSGADGRFVLKGVSAEQKTHLLILHAERGLGVTLTIDPAKELESIEAKLVPTRTLKSRVVDENDKPVPSARVSLSFNVKISEESGGYTLTSRPAQESMQANARGEFTYANLVPGGSYTVQVSAIGRAAAQANFKVEGAADPWIPPLVLQANNLAIAGTVVDPAGNPIEGVHVVIMPRNQNLVHNHDFMNTGKDGKFRFNGLPKAEYRLIGEIWKPTDKLDKDGRPTQTLEAYMELRVESGREDIRLVLTKGQK